MKQCAVIRMLEIKRASGKYFIGCFSQINSVYQHTIVTRIQRRWPEDIIGKRLGKISEPACRLRS